MIVGRFNRLCAPLAAPARDDRALGDPRTLVRDSIIGPAVAGTMHHVYSAAARAIEERGGDSFEQPHPLKSQAHFFYAEITVKLDSCEFAQSVGSDR